MIDVNAFVAEARFRLLWLKSARRQVWACWVRKGYCWGK